DQRGAYEHLTGTMQGSLDVRKANLRKAWEIAEDLAKDYPADPIVRDVQAAAAAELGSFLWQNGQPAEAETYLHKGLTAAKALASEFPRRAQIPAEHRPHSGKARNPVSEYRQQRRSGEAPVW